MRISAAVGALLGWFALLLQLYLILAQSPAGAPAMVEKKLEGLSAETRHQVMAGGAMAFYGLN